jgi:hypothetical protein
MRRLNGIILIEEMNQSRRNDILLIRNVHCDTTCVLERLAVRNDLLALAITSELILKQRVLLFVCFHDCSYDSSTVHDAP